MNEVWAKDGVLRRASRAGLLVLDVDGVLLDPAPSYYRAARETAAWAASRALGRAAGQAPTDADVRAFKRVGGWNDDFDLAVGLAWALVLRELRHMPIDGTARRSSGGLPTIQATVEALVPEELRRRLDPHLVRERSASFYAGRSRCLAMYGIDPERHPEVPEDGLWALEPVLASSFLLKACGFDLALFTGRNAAEAELALERLEVAIPPERRMVEDGHLPRKPAPDGILRLAASVQAGPLVYVGDSVDDQHAALAYRAVAERTTLPDLLFVRVFPDGGTDEELEEARFAGADAIARGLDEFLEALPSRDRRDDG